MRLILVCFLLLLAPLARADFTPLDRVAVVVNENVILQSEIDKRVADVRFQLEQRGTPLPPPEVLRRQVTEQLVLEKLQLGMASRAGIRIDDKEVNGALEDIARQNGLTLPGFQQKLDATAGTSYAEVREQVKQELIISRLRNRIMQERIRITEQDVQNFLRSPGGQAALDGEYRLGHILVALPGEASPADIAAAEARVKQAQAALADGKDFGEVAATYSSAETALKGGDLGWRKGAQLPTLFAEPVPSMQVGDVAGPFRTPGGFHLIKLLGKRGGKEMLVPQWQARHILIKPTEILSREDARQKLTDIRAKLEAGASFEDLARTYSDDPGSARQGGSLGWVAAGEMVPEFEAVMRRTPTGQVSEVFQSPYGWHVLQVTGTRQQDMSEQYRANQARQALYLRAYDNELADWLRELRSSAFIEDRSGVLKSNTPR